MSGTAHTLPFDQLSPRDFERLCLWLVQREGYEEAEHLGAAGSEQGRDLIAWREGQLWAFQCKRVQSFGPTKAMEEIDKLTKVSEDERPVGLIFLVTCDVSARTRQKARKRCGELGMECRFWASTEFDEKVKRHPEIVREFFQVGVAQVPEALTGAKPGVVGGQVDQKRPRQVQLLLLWGDLPFRLMPHVPPDVRALLLSDITGIREPAGTGAEWLPSLPPVPILSLDPGDRVERAFKAAGMPLKVVRTQRDLPVKAQHSLIKLAGDLETRSGVVLSLAEIRELRNDPEKRYLLAEARRAAEGGALLMVGCNPADGDFRAWWAALAPTFQDVDLYAVGEPSAPWPEGVTCLGSDLEAARAVLEGAGDENEPEVTYNITAIRDLMLAGFTGGDLRRLVMYAQSPILQQLSNEFSGGDGLNTMVEKTITHCRNKDCMADLLAEVKVANPRQYARFETRLLA